MPAPVVVQRTRPPFEASVQARTDAAQAAIAVAGEHLALQPRVTWYTWLIAAAILTAFAAATGIKPRGTRHVAGTQLMGVARVVLVFAVVVVLWFAYAASR